MIRLHPMVQRKGEGYIPALALRTTRGTMQGCAAGTQPMSEGEALRCAYAAAFLACAQHRGKVTLAR